jgi:hypothetical protein
MSVGAIAVRKGGGNDRGGIRAGIGAFCNHIRDKGKDVISPPFPDLSRNHVITHGLSSGSDATPAGNVAAPFDRGGGWR